MRDKKLALVTGSNKGIGYAIVKGLCEKFDGDVMLLSRDEQRGRAAVANLRKLGINPLYYKLDVLDNTTIKQLIHFINDNYHGIDILVNNAAIIIRPVNSNESFYMQAVHTLKTNYFAVANLCKQLFPLLKTNAQVVNISSCGGHLSKIFSTHLKKKFASKSLTIHKLNKLMYEFIQSAKDETNKVIGWGESTYNVSKVGVSALTRIQQRSFDNDCPEKNISVNSVHPGYVDTDMTNHKGPLSIEEGARAPLFLTLGDHNFKGQFIWKDSSSCDWTSQNTPEPY